MKKKWDSSMIQGEAVVVGLLTCELTGVDCFFFLSCAYFSLFEYHPGESPSEKGRRGVFFPDFQTLPVAGGGDLVNQLILRSKAGCFYHLGFSLPAKITICITQHPGELEKLSF